MVRVTALDDACLFTITVSGAGVATGAGEGAGGATGSGAGATGAATGADVRGVPRANDAGLANAEGPGAGTNGEGAAGCEENQIVLKSNPHFVQKLAVSLTLVPHCGQYLLIKSTLLIFHIKILRL